MYKQRRCGVPEGQVSTVNADPHDQLGPDAVFNTFITTLSLLVFVTAVT